MKAIFIKSVLGSEFYYQLVKELLSSDISFPFINVEECNLWIINNYINGCFLEIVKRTNKNIYKENRVITITLN